MESFSPEVFAGVVALIGVVIVAAAVISGPVDRLGIPQAALFLAFGALIGPFGFGLAEFGFGSPELGAIAIVSLVLVLFSDSVALDVRGLKRHATLAAIVLGPGTLVTAGIIAAAAAILLGLSLPAAVLVGATLASTDPVMMRGLLRRPNVPAPASYALGTESGLNDVVVLPLVLLSIAYLAPATAMGAGQAGALVVSIFLLGPLAGAVVGYLSVRLLELVRGRYGMRRDYEALYVIGVAFSAYAAAEMVDGSGFMAAFAAGLTIAVLDVELCDCFMEFGQTSSEMFLLFAFVAFGTSLVWEGLGVLDAGTIGFAVFAVLVRSAVLWIALLPMRLDALSKRLIVWYGPRGLNSLLLALLPMFAGVRGTEKLFAIVALVVLLSVVFHGVLLILFTRSLREAEPATVSSGKSQVTDAGGAGRATVADGELITFEELDRLVARGEDLRILDARTEKSYSASSSQARGAIRVSPDHAVESAARLALPRNAWLAAYCA